MALAPPPARAAGAVFGLKPVGQPPRSGFFVLAGRPGAVLTARLQVVNVSGRAGEVRLYPADATTGQTTGAVYRGASRARADVGAWIVLERTRLSLGPRQAAAVGFRVRVPAQVRPGQHLGGIVAEPVAVTATQRARRGRARFSVKVKEQAIIAVQVNLPGAGPQRLGITRLRAGANPGYQTLLIGLANTGNVFLKGRGTITVTTRGGRRLRRQAFALDTFVPRTSVDDPIVVRGRALPAGRYLGSIAIAYAHRHHD